MQQEEENQQGKNSQDIMKELQAENEALKVQLSQKRLEEVSRNQALTNQTLIANQLEMMSMLSEIPRLKEGINQLGELLNDILQSDEKASDDEVDNKMIKEKEKPKIEIEDDEEDLEDIDIEPPKRKRGRPSLAESEKKLQFKPFNKLVEPKAVKSYDPDEDLNEEDM